MPPPASRRANRASGMPCRSRPASTWSRGPTATIRPSQIATTGASAEPGPPTAAASSSASSPWVEPAAHARRPASRPATPRGSAGPARRRCSTALDEAERHSGPPAQRGRAQGVGRRVGRCVAGGGEPQLQGHQRVEVAEPDRLGRGREAGRGRPRRAGAPAWSATSSSAASGREPDQLRLGEADAVLRRQLADRRPRPARSASCGSRAGSSTPGRGPGGRAPAPRRGTRWPGRAAARRRTRGRGARSASRARRRRSRG